jgi:zinc D-Ala-D-Ala carboxypeptidase
MFKIFNKRVIIWTTCAIILMVVLSFTIALRQEQDPKITLLLADTLITYQEDPQETSMKDLVPMPTPEIFPDIDLLLGKTNRASNEKLVVINQRYANRAGMLMHKDAYNAFLDMHKAASADGVSLIIVSAFRDFNHQKRIWENKWNGRQMLSGGINTTDIDDETQRAREILRFSSMPGTSRHHWGTDIDLNSLNNNYFEKGEGLRVYNWLAVHAHKFGFCQPYTAHGKGRTGGYEEEKWHWSYKPVAELYLRGYSNNVNYDHIIGFDGWENAKSLDVIKNYVFNVNSECK